MSINKKDIITIHIRNKENKATNYVNIKFDSFLKILKRETTINALYRQLTELHTFSNNNVESKLILTGQLSSMYREAYPERIEGMIAKAKLEALMTGKTNTYRTHESGNYLFLRDYQDDYAEMLNEK